MHKRGHRFGDPASLWAEALICIGHYRHMTHGNM